jgi:hypothetical protein
VTTIRDKFHFEYRTSEGQPVSHGQFLVTPISRVLAVRLPHLGFVWNRPVAVRVEDGRSTRKLPIVNVTFLAEIGLYAIGLAAATVVFRVGRARQSRKTG